MMRPVLAVIVAVASCQLTSPPTTDARCSKENCRRMTDGCRVELALSVPRACLGYEGDAGLDAVRERIDEYCVEACHGTQSGSVVECFAKADDACRADANFTPDCQRDVAAPESGCEETCANEKRACDTACSGGEACSACRNAGTPDCSAECPGTDSISCIDCSADCLPAYFACADACPRAK